MTVKTTGKEPVISGPYSLYDGSFVVEFLEPDPSCNATVLLRATYKANHPLVQLGKAHPQTPPFHLHYSQSETFQVLQGAVGTTQGWEARDRVWTPEDKTVEIPPWRPHTFWPVAKSTEDTVMLLWAHPNDVPNPMDRLFFQTVLRFTSDIHEKKVSMDPFQLMLLQHVTDSTLVWFPRATFLGPLRWWIPSRVQAAFAAVARLMGYTPLMAKYSDTKID